MRSFGAFSLFHVEHFHLIAEQVSQPDGHLILRPRPSLPMEPASFCFQTKQRASMSHG